MSKWAEAHLPKECLDILEMSCKAGPFEGGSAQRVQRRPGHYAWWQGLFCPVGSA